MKKEQGPDVCASVLVFSHCSAYNTTLWDSPNLGHYCAPGKLDSMFVTDLPQISSTP